MTIWIVLATICVLAIVAVVFINQPSFGRIPQGERLERIKRSANYRNGQFRNLHETPLLTSDKDRFRIMLDFLFKKKEDLFMVKSPSQKIYIGGDGGYDTHFSEIGKRFPSIDLAIIENGQYDKNWQYIHLMPQYLVQAIRDLGTKKVLTVHHSKYALANHRWNEPLMNAKKAADSLNVLLPVLGEIIMLDDE